MTSTSPHRVVVVGAGFAGLAAVRALPQTPDSQITLVDRRYHHPVGFGNRPLGVGLRGLEMGGSSSL